MSELILTLEQPAQFGDRARKDFVLSTFEHVPGSVVRGAFAATWLARNGPSKPGTTERKEFLDLFEGGVRFGSLLRDGTEYMSLAVVGHKYDPLDTCERVDWDRATDDDPPLYCPNQKCGSPIEQRRGLDGARPTPARRTSVAIGEDGVARDGQLFTRQTLPAGEIFRGTLVASPDQSAILASLGPVRIGGRRTTHGLAQVAIRDAGTPLTAQRRVGDDDLIVRLRSPGIFTDDHGRPAREPSPAELEAALGVPASVQRRWVRWEQAGGWHVASGLPKQQELTVAAGSTFLIHPERTVTDSGLARLAARGLGLRRHEGFGDLAPPPKLRSGRAEREAEAARLRDLTYKVAPLNRLQRSRELWSRLLAEARAHAAGDPPGTQWLRRLGDSPVDKDVSEAVKFLIGLPAADAAYVVGELSR